MDGVKANYYCFGYAGVTPADGSTVMATSGQSLSGVPLGNHTVQTYFYSRNGSSTVYRHFSYKVYKP